MTTVEEWRWLPGCEGFTEVSDLGRVRRWYKHRDRSVPPLRLTEPQIVAPYLSSGCPSFYSRGERQGAYSVPQAVMLAFFGPRPSGSHVVCHFPNAEKSDCRLDNLRWGTGSDNVRDFHAHLVGDDAVLARLAQLRKEHPHLRQQIYASGCNRSQQPSPTPSDPGCAGSTAPHSVRGERSGAVELVPFSSIRDALTWMSCVVALQTCVDVVVLS
jgi:hypothetical protein